MDLLDTWKVTLGYEREDDESIRVGPKLRSTHMHVIGSPSRGKSKFLEHLIRQDIMAGHGVCFIDPHGTTYDNILRWIKEGRWDEERRIHLLDPTLDEWTFGLNPLAQAREAELDFSINTVVNAIAQAFGAANTDNTPLLERILTIGLYGITLLGKTMVELPEFISAKNIDLREHFLDLKLGDDYIRMMVQDLHDYSERERREETRSTFNRMARVLTSPILRRMLAQQDNRLDLRQIIENRDILLVNLSTGKKRVSPERARLVGSLLTNEFFLAGYEREEGSTPYYLYIDECHEYLNKDVERMLNESRKRGIHLVLAHQNLGQLRDASEKIFSGVMGSAQARVVFGIANQEEAQYMARQVIEFDLEEPKISLKTYQTTGHRLRWLESEGESETTGRSRSSGGSRQEGASKSKAKSRHRGSASSSGAGESSSEVDSAGGTAGGGLTEQELEDGTIIVVVSQNSGNNWHQGSTKAQSSFYGSSESEGESETENAAYSYLEGENWSDTNSSSETMSRGRHQTLVPNVEATYMTTFSLEEQAYRAALHIKNLRPGEALFQPPLGQTLEIVIPRVFDADVGSEELAAFKRKLIQRQSWVVPTEEAEAVMAARFKQTETSAWPEEEEGW